jgi:hypothetical protein
VITGHLASDHAFRNWLKDPHQAAQRALGHEVHPRPAVVGLEFPMTCRSVDLPDPDGPTIATNSPRLTEKDTPRRAGTGGSSP